MDKAFWRAIIAADYALPAGHSVDTLTAKLVEYLGSPDPELRDRIAYFVLGTWIEAGHYSPSDLMAMMEQMLANLRHGLGEDGTESVFLRSFSALVLAEIIAEDNRRPFLDDSQVRRVLAESLAYVAAEADLRGYVPDQGWAHACAHAADLLQVLAESPRMGIPELLLILDSVGRRVTFPVDYLFVHDEDERLVRAAVAVMRRNLLTLDDLTNWLVQVATPTGNPLWIESFLDVRDLGARHNSKLFLRSLYFELAFAENRPAVAEDLLPRVVASQQAIRAWA